MPDLIQNTLYLLTGGLYLHRDNFSLRVEQEKVVKLTLPVHNVDSVAIFGDTLVSPAAMQLCWENGISLCWFTDSGKFMARVEGVPKGSVMLRRAQHQAADDIVRTRELARSFVAGKIRNTRTFILRSARDREEAAEITLRAAATQLGALLVELQRVDNLDAVRGVEGQAAAVAFSVYSLHLKATLREIFPFQHRNRRPPRDAINSLLSFLYALLRHDCISALTAVGLDPFVGFLHADRANRESLALDLMEEFRPLADRVGITLLNRGELKVEDFKHREGGAVELSDKARRSIVTAWKERKLEELTHPAYQQKCRVGQLFHLQARILARAIRQEASGYLPYLG